VEGVAITPMPVLSSGFSFHLKGGTSGLKVVFFYPLLPREDITEVVRQTSFSLKRGGEAEKEGFWPMREALGERFGVVFSFALVVTDTELACAWFDPIHSRCFSILWWLAFSSWFRLGTVLRFIARELMVVCISHTSLLRFSILSTNR
jgi:hypothetical protein